ncbi:UTRA domain-containing protein, partial [Acinetobacter baumannii]
DSVIAGERFAELLQVAAWDPLLVIEGVDRDESGRPFDCYRTWVRPDRMKVEVEVTPTTGASTALHEPTLASASSKGASDDH